VREMHATWLLLYRISAQRLFQVSTLCAVQRDHAAARDWQIVVLKRGVRAFPKDGFVMATMTAVTTAMRTPSSVVS